MPDTISIPSTTRYLGVVRRFVEAHARAFGFPSGAIAELKLAVDEACTNVINHAYLGDDTGTIELRISADTTRFTIIIRDQGHAFDKKRYREPDLLSSLQKRRGGGYGVFIMRHLMDDVTYSRSGAFNEVHLTKLRPAGASER